MTGVPHFPLTQKDYLIPISPTNLPITGTNRKSDFGWGNNIV